MKMKSQIRVLCVLAATVKKPVTQLSLKNDYNSLQQNRMNFVNLAEAFPYSLNFKQYLVTVT